MPPKKKTPAKATKKAVTKSVKKKATAITTKVKALSPVPFGPKPAPVVKTWRVFIESSAFFPVNSSDGWVDNYQDGRHTAVPDGRLSTPIVLPVGAKLISISIHYTNSVKAKTPMAVFLRKHADRHSPSGEIEMSFINLPNTSLPPDNYLTVTDTSFPDGGVIQDRFLHYLEIPNTGDYGTSGKITVRGVSLVYKF